MIRINVGGNPWGSIYSTPTKPSLFLCHRVGDRQIMVIDIVNGDLTIADALAAFRPPSVRYVSASVETKSISKAELDLSTTWRRSLQMVTESPDWVDKLKERYDLASVHVPKAGKTLPFVRSYLSNSTLDSSVYLETQEPVTHQFHRDCVLTPAVHLAIAYVVGGGTANGFPFSQAAKDAVQTLTARPGDRTGKSLIYPDHQMTVQVTEQRWKSPPQCVGDTTHATLLLAEDKTHRVMFKAAPLIQELIKSGGDRYPTEMLGCDVATRVLTQVSEPLCDIVTRNVMTCLDVESNGRSTIESRPRSLDE